MSIIQHQPPEYLSDKAKSLWRAVVPRRASSIERCALLTSALEALDRADEARRQLATVGLVTNTERSGVAHAHPCVKIEKESRQQFKQFWTALGLEWDNSEGKQK